MDSNSASSPSSDSPANDASESSVQPLSAAARRCLGVLVEKAKTTPDNYPLSLAAIITGANQKSARDPRMQLDESDALAAMDELRGVGAAREIQGSGRVTKYRHAAYEWMDVDSPGAAIMTELLLRGPQTLGELRTRASRMYTFIDLSAVQAEIDSLTKKGLVEALTPAGRGQTFAHCLYTPQERQHLPAKIQKMASTDPADKTPGSAANDDRIDRISQRLDEVTERLAKLEQKLADWES